MAHSILTETKQGFFHNIRHFPIVSSGRINIVTFLNATSDLVCLVERLGKVFMPVKNDMQGNINKIKLYEYNDDSCLLELMADETRRGEQKTVEGVLWLNRALLFFEILFQELVSFLQPNGSEDNMKQVFATAYEKSLKKHHNWAAQQMFKVMCKMSPSLQQIMVSMDIDDVKVLETSLTQYNVSLNMVRCKIDDFFIGHDLLKKSSMS